MKDFFVSTSNTCRQLQKARLKHVNAVVLRDQLRNELAKQQRIEEEMREKREQQRLDIAKLNLMINQAEEQMVRLRKRYETAVQHRNDRSVRPSFIPSSKIFIIQTIACQILVKLGIVCLCILCQLRRLGCERFCEVIESSHVTWLLLHKIKPACHVRA